MALNHAIKEGLPVLGITLVPALLSAILLTGYVDDAIRALLPDSFDLDQYIVEDPQGAKIFAVLNGVFFAVPSAVFGLSFLVGTLSRPKDK